ncbi:hypothetical protein H10PHJ05_24 [Aeromonas phage HJ05]|nr:hypothetical protein H10PHJ05_24 [Aeromonas phage HJ05]
MSEDIRYVRVYVTEARAGDIPMGFREVLEIDGEGLYPSVFYLGTMSLCALLKEDYETATEREVTPAMCKSMQAILSHYKFSGTVPDRDEAVMRIQAWLRKKEAAASPRVRQRVAPPVLTQPAARTRVRSAPQSAPAVATTRTRVRSVAAPVEADTPKVRTRTRAIK